jgi:hypothetical protein
MLGAIPTIALGAAGWLITHFILTPILRFYDLRRITHDEFIYYSNASTDSERTKAGEVHRRLATNWKALHDTNWWWVAWFVRLSGYDLPMAVENLFGYSNTIGRHASWRPLTATHRVKVEKALKLPLSIAWDMVEATEEESLRRLAMARSNPVVSGVPPQTF